MHYPTDINLLLDAMRKVIFLTGDLSEKKGLTEWRQHEHNFRGIKKLMRRAQNKKRGNPRKDEQKKKKEEEIKKAHQDYIDSSKLILGKVTQTILKIEEPTDLITIIKIKEIKNFIYHANRQIDQINRRVILGETIPHDEKVFSIFQPHTEWIVKGKAGVPQELGLKVGVFEDQYQFILHHQVIEKKTDDQIAVSITKETKERFKNLSQASYDKGFHSPNNQEELKKELETVILPRKGKLSQKAKAHENNPHFLKARRQHSAVESAINALEHHGLGTCPDHGIHGFKRYVALAVVAFNIGRIGAILKAQEQKIAERKRKKYSKRAQILKIAA